MRPAELRQRLAEAGFHHRRALGQHFLLDRPLLEAIAAAGGVTASDCVLEIGTGAGTLTAVLAERAARVVTVEVDDRLAAIASEMVGGRGDVVHVEGDALAAAPGAPAGALHPGIEGALAAAGAEGLTVRCVSNFPYAIATPFIVRLLERALVDGAFPLASVAGLVQREVADRLRAAAIDKAYGAPSAEVQALARVRLDRAVDRRAFWPPPKVASAVIRVDPLPPAERPSGERWAAYRDLVRAVFRYRRKAIANALARGLDLEPARARAALAAAGIDPRARVEQLDVARLLALADAAAAARGGPSAPAAATADGAPPDPPAPSAPRAASLPR